MVEISRGNRESVCRGCGGGVTKLVSGKGPMCRNTGDLTYRIANPFNRQAWERDLGLGMKWRVTMKGVGVGGGEDRQIDKETGRDRDIQS